MAILESAHEGAEIDQLTDLLSNRHVVALVGAGCSTESGIPDYRGPETASKVRRPILYQEFVRDPDARTRYWSRSMVGWPRMRVARPNAGHLALAQLEQLGPLRGVITQNVDGLHQEAGSRRVVELHGTLDRVRCLACDGTIGRAAFQEELRAINTKWLERHPLESGPGDAESAPDGDAELTPQAMESFIVPGCASCGGVLKPDVVFFGENVPRATVTQAWELFGEGEVLLVIGSSLTVYSGRRFVYRAVQEGVPIAIVNIGPTRADEVAILKVEGRSGEVLPEVVAGLRS